MEPSSPKSRKGSLTKAVLGGLALGCLGGALYLEVSAILRGKGVDCAQLAPQECLFEQQLNSTLMRWQGLGGVALALLSLALFLWLRADRRKVADAAGAS